MKNHPEYQYLNLLQDILEHGEKVPNRTGVDTIRLLGITHRYNFEDGFPLLTTKRVWFKGVVHELLWFLKGSTNIQYLVDNGVNIWNDDAYRHYKKRCEENGWRLDSKQEFIRRTSSDQGAEYAMSNADLGPVYGKQWRKWDNWSVGFDGDHEYIDQIQNLIDGLKNNPSSRRHILNSWNVAEIDQMALPPCHVMAQFTISRDKLWCQMYQRSCDSFLGVPYNVASYSLLTHMIAQVVGIEPGGFIWTGHDVHIYENHIDAVKEQLTREPRPFPKLELNPDVKSIDDFKYEDIKVVDYNPHPTIRAELVT